MTSLFAGCAVHHPPDLFGADQRSRAAHARRKRFEEVRQALIVELQRLLQGCADLVGIRGFDDLAEQVGEIRTRTRARRVALGHPEAEV